MGDIGGHDWQRNEDSFIAIRQEPRFTIVAGRQEAVRSSSVWLMEHNGILAAWAGKSTATSGQIVRTAAKHKPCS